jgi:uncharacterized membrane protein YciS (DUF1049 family)
MSFKMNLSDKAMVALVATNGVVAWVQKICAAVEPVIAPLISLGQLGIAIATIVWICVRVRGVRLDNKIKEKELKK